jgi:ornithine cyclodeaminase/alanine dehydrogenase-like protein (mu-crystallin family)
MTLIISNADVETVLTMKDTIAALETSYRRLAVEEAVCRPRIDIQIPTKDPKKVYQWGTMEGGAVGDYFAIRMKSDVIYEQEYNGAVTQEKYCTKPGLYCGLILLISTENGEPVAILNDGVLQHMRVGADGGIGVKYMSREDSHVVGILGSGGMARSHMDAFMEVRDIKKIQVYSPTPANRERFAEEMRAKHGVEVKVCDNPRDIYKGADIVAGLTDSAVPVLNGEWVEKGTHVINVGAGGAPDEATMRKIDVYFRFGNAPAPWGLPEMALADEYVTYAARPTYNSNFKLKRAGKRGHTEVAPDRMVLFKDIVSGSNRGRTTRDQITFSERGNLQGAQFYAVAGVAYEKAKAKGLGYNLPTELLLQDIRD